MINTNRNDYKKDLEEVIYMFCDGEGIEISHHEENDGRVFKDRFVFLGEEYNFENTKVISDNLELKRYEKRFSKLGLYSILKKHFNVSYKWGALTGIRPVRMAYSVGDGFEREFKEIFDVSNEKTQLVKDIINTQKGIIDLKGEYSGLFVSIPFCPSRCAYCSFISEEISKCKYLPNYVDALCKEIENSLILCKNLRSVYVGGGTPVCLDNESLTKILTAIKPCVKDGIEFTVEAGRPDSITEDKLEILKNFKVNRICVNPQTFSNKTLNLIGRKHSANSVIEKFELAKKFGFIINTDIIAGLPNESFDDFKNTIDTIIKLNPENFTVHTLCLKKGSKLKEKVKRLSVNEISLMTDYAYKMAKENGYNPYYLYRQKYSADNLENVGYAKKGKECVYNIDVMEETSSNIACGANGVSKKVIPIENRLERYGNPKDVLTYVKKVDEIIRAKKELFS
ncbi:MAG: coproporphyrinogen dehydrogenase HemZ [Clostridia bacterium]|nr:coproporphyrinogen dehydrogenase HemZ [Clostridia bacterium]